MESSLSRTRAQSAHAVNTERCSDWVKWRANRGQEFVISGYISNGEMLDSILVGYFDGRDLLFAGRIRAGLPAEFRRIVPPYFEELAN